MKRNIIHLVLVFILSFIGYIYSADAQNNTTKILPSIDINPNQLISSPISIEINSNGSWMAHEGELGVVTLLDESGEKLATAIMKSKDGEWMVTGDALFLAELNFETPKTLKGKLRFENRVITSEGNTKKERFETPVRFYHAPVKTYYFGEQKKINDSFSGLNFHFIKLEVTKDSSFQGIEINSPYGTDGSRSALQGTFSNNTFNGTKQMLAEGEIYTQEFFLKLQNIRIELGYNLPSGEAATLPELTETAYKNLVDEYEKNFLFNRVNTSDRSRLSKLEMENKFGFTAKDITKLNFIELEIDLDGSYQTREFLIYPYGPMLCGTGGCDLFVVNNEGKLLAETSVVKMPVYIATNRAVNPAKAKQVWKDLYVWSNGAFRRLVFRNGSYTSNASMAPAMAEENLELNPQNFIKIMDFID